MVALWIGLATFFPASARAQNHLHFPVIFNSYCSKDLVFLAFGDSITSCFMDSNLCAFPQCGYPKRLYDLLKSRFNRDFAFYNVGIGGERTSGGISRLADTLNHPENYNVCPFFCTCPPSNFYPTHSGNTDPDLVIIMEGINDLGDWSVKGVPLLGTIEDNIRAMVLTALLSQKKVVLATLTPVVPINEERELQGMGVEVLNSRIRQIADDYQIPLADVYSAFLNYPDWEGALMSTALADDGLHPNESGFAVMAEVMYQTIVTHLTATGCYP
jgi:lysophospholipase L1-like esterase